ncbi:hypothetical protein ABPG74_017758 [Tetrahymena malaccensis]
MISSNQTADQENKVENKVANAEHMSQSYDSIPQSLSPAVIAQIMDKGQSQPQSQSIKQIQNEYPQYDWDNKWLKGDEYANMLEKIEEYCKQYNLQKFGKKTHPEDIYRAPQNGLIYFVEGNCVGSEFGFPRVPFRKQYRWKKMNFTTDLPKKKPQVTYIVASSVKCQKSQGNDKSKQDNNKKEQDVYRMHAVILYKNSQAKQQQQQGDDTNNNNNSAKANNSESKQYILCHIRKMDINDDEKIGIKQLGTLNSNSASESSQDLAMNSNSQKSGKQGKQAYKKQMINDIKRLQDEQDDDNESDEIDEMEDDEIKENQRQNKRKNSSLYEKGSNQDSYGIQIQTLLPHDTNKQSKAKSKLQIKQQSKLGENYQKIEVNKSIGRVSQDANPDKPTEILNVKQNNQPDYIDQSMQYLISYLAQNSAELKKNKQNEVEKNINSQNNAGIGNNNSFTNQKKGSENFNISMLPDLKQQSSPKQRKRSPRNQEDNSISSSSSNTNQAKEEEIQNQLQQRLQSFPQTGTNAFINQSQVNNSLSPSMLNMLTHNLFQQLPQSYSYQQGGMVMIQPTNYLQFPYLILPQQIVTPTNQNSVNIQPQQLQNYLLQQQPQQIIQNMTRPPAVNLDLLNLYLQNTQNQTELNYRDMYSMQMNNAFSNNLNYLPNQNNQNAP